MTDRPNKKTPVAGTGNNTTSKFTHLPSLLQSIEFQITGIEGRLQTIEKLITMGQGIITDMDIATIDILTENIKDACEKYVKEMKELHPEWQIIWHKELVK